MLKLLGLFTLVTACGMVGIMKAQELKSRICLLIEMQNLISEMKGKMNYFHEPLFQIFQRSAQKSNLRAFQLPADTLVEFREKGGEISQIWAEKTNEIYKGTSLMEDDLEIIRHIGTYIGQSSFENQQMQFKYTEERLATQLDTARAEYQQKGPMYQKTGFFLGMISALVLI